MIDWWVSCKVFTCWIRTKEGRVVDGAPIIRRWIGQSFEKLLTYYGAECEQLEGRDNGKLSCSKLREGGRDN